MMPKAVRLTMKLSELAGMWYAQKRHPLPPPSLQLYVSSATSSLYCTCVINEVVCLPGVSKWKTGNVTINISSINDHILCTILSLFDTVIPLTSRKLKASCHTKISLSFTPVSLHHNHTHL